MPLATGPAGVSEVLLDILVVLVAAKLAAELAERIRFPVVAAEIVAGVLIGPSVLGLVGEGNAVLAVIGEIGVLLLLLDVGLEMDLAEMRTVGRASLLTAVVGVALPMASGFAVAELFGDDPKTALFLGAALAATSVGITARVFSDLRALATVEARTVLGAAVADDVLGLLILTVVVRLVSEGSVSALEVVGIVVVAVAFLVVTAVLGSRVGPTLFRQVQRRSRATGTVVALAFAFTLGFALLAEQAKLAPIVGAFVAGLALSRSDTAERIKRDLTPVGHLFIPVFFLQIGIDVDVSAFGRPSVLLMAGALLVVAVAGKLAAAIGMLGSPGDKLLVGIGMIPRGEVGLIFATIGLELGVLDGELYAALLLVVLLTTLLAPPLLRWRVHASRAAARPVASAPEPAGGWLRVEGGVVELAATPPDRLALHLGLQAALAVRAAQPGPALLDWLGRLDDAPLRWDGAATELLFEVLREGDSRSWRFLETTGLLERGLPELAAALERRRGDPSLLDPAHVLRWSLVEEIRELVHDDPRAAESVRELEHPEWLLLAALILDTAGPDAAPVVVARRLAQRLDLGALAEQELALLVGDHALLRAAAARSDGLDEERVVQVAIHLDRPERARALYVLSLALGALDPDDRARLDELAGRVLAVLARGELTGLDARNLVERRRAEARRHAGPQVGDRIAHAPRAYVLSQEIDALARHAALVEPLPGRNEVRVAVRAGERPDEWRVEVACRDRPGLLARVSGVLADHGLDVLDAVVATWGDGGALESFGVRGPTVDEARLRAAIETALTRPLAAPPDPGAEVRFDDDASPWYTLCEVRGPDRRGMLHTITTGLAAAGVSVHSARLVTEGGRVLDRFELTDRRGGKLDEAAKQRIFDAIAGGVAGRRGRRSR